jgi:hypothetical protein
VDENKPEAEPRLISRDELEQAMGTDELPLLEAAEKFANNVLGADVGPVQADPFLRLALGSLIRNAFIAGADWGKSEERKRLMLAGLSVGGSA